MLIRVVRHVQPWITLVSGNVRLLAPATRRPAYRLGFRVSIANPVCQERSTIQMNYRMACPFCKLNFSDALLSCVNVCGLKLICFKSLTRSVHRWTLPSPWIL